MGLSNYPSPAEGLFWMILANTTFSITILKSFQEFIIRILNFRQPPPSPITMNPAPEHKTTRYDIPLRLVLEKLHHHIPVIHFSPNESSPEPGCTVCLNHFSTEHKINRLRCGHLFHEVCLQRWLDYWNITCPLCRTRLVTEEEALDLGIDNELLEEMHDCYSY